MASVLQSTTATMNKPLPMKTATLVSNSSRRTAYSDNASDIVDADYVDQNIPKMELLKLNYLSRSRNNLANAQNDESVQLRDKKRGHTKQQLYQRSHSDGLLKVSELSKLSAVANEAAKQQMSTKTVTQPTKTQPLPMPQPQTNPLKYTVYKKHNSCDQTAALKNEKLQYTNDDAIFKARRKYSMFEGRKRSTSDNIQFYFDSKSYEQHVDNKMYGVLMTNNFSTSSSTKTSNSSSDGKSSVKRLAPAAPPSNYENKSNSWNFVKATKSLLNNSNIGRMASGQKYIKNVPSRKMSRDASLMDLSRIGQMFRETRRASADDLLDGIRKPLGNDAKGRASVISAVVADTNAVTSDNKTASTTKKVKKLSTEFENKCLCECKPKSESGRKSSAPAKLFTDLNLNRLNDNCMRARRKLGYAPLPSNELIGLQSKRVPPELPPKNGIRADKAKTLANGHHSHPDDTRTDSQFFLLDRKARSKSIPSEHAVTLFGHSQSQCSASPSTCGYKNCTFVNCPMSSITAALSTGNNHADHARDSNASKTVINANNDTVHTNTGKRSKNNISITKIDTISNKSKLYLRTKDFNDDDDGIDSGTGSRNSTKELVKEIELVTNCIALNNLKNLKNTSGACDVTGSTNGSTTIPIKFSPNQTNLNNSMKCKSVEKLDFNSTTTIENKKFNNIVSTESMHSSFSKNDDDNRVKIFIRNEPIISTQFPTTTTTSASPIYEMSPADSIASDYYDSVAGDHVDKYCLNMVDINGTGNVDGVNVIIPAKQNACNLTDFGITPTSNLLTSGDELTDSGSPNTTASKKNLRNLFPSRLGCDGAIFWNDCYYYDEHACCTCKTNDFDKVTMKTGEFCACGSKRDSGNSSADVDDDDDDVDDGFDESKQVAFRGFI